MLTRIAMLVFAQSSFSPAPARPRGRAVHKYLNDTSVLVKSTPIRPEAPCSNGSTLIGGLGSVTNSPFVSAQDAADLERVHGVLQDMEAAAGRPQRLRTCPTVTQRVHRYVVGRSRRAGLPSASLRSDHHRYHLPVA
jgi:hypothetical protein